MVILNPSFEDAGQLPGEAEHWTLVTVTSREELAGFDVDPTRAWEGFERWFERWSTFEEVTAVRAFFDPAPEGVEDFEEGWANDLIFEEWSGAQLVVALLGVGEIDGFETGWANDHYATAWEGVARVVGAFDGEQREDFEDQWGGNEGYLWSWGAVGSAAAPLEGFEGAWEVARSLTPGA